MPQCMQQGLGRARRRPRRWRVSAVVVEEAVVEARMPDRLQKRRRWGLQVLARERALVPALELALALVLVLGPVLVPLVETEPHSLLLAPSLAAAATPAAAEAGATVGPPYRT